MTKLLLPIICLFATISFSQPDGWVREDVGIGHLMICKQKSKVGIWSNARGNFLDPPHPGHILHFPGVQFLLDVDTKAKEVKVYHYYKGGVQLLEAANDSGKFWFGHIKASEWNAKLKTDATDPKYEKDLGAESTLIFVDAGNENYDFRSCMSYHFVDDFIKVNLIHDNTRDDFIYPIKSVLYPEEDSVDSDGNVVYYPRDERTVYSSGLFDLKQGKWIIPPKYEGVHEWKGIYGAYYWPDWEKDPELAGKGIVYDYYRFDKKLGVLPTSFMSYQKFAFPLELWPLASEKVWYDADSIYIYHQTKKGVGLYQVAVSGKSNYDGYSLDWLSSEGRFEPVEIFEPKYRYIMRSGNCDYLQSPQTDKYYYTLAAKNDSVYDLLISGSARLDEEGLSEDTLIEDVVINDYIELRTAEIWLNKFNKSDKNEMVAIIDGKYFIRIHPQQVLGEDARIFPLTNDYEGPVSKFRTEKLVNGKLMVTAYSLEDWRYATPVISMVTYEDSLDENGNVLYYPPDPGIYHSGVFDPASKSWQVEPKYLQVYYTNNMYLLKEPIYGQYHLLDSIVYHLQKPDGNFEFKNLGQDQFGQSAYDRYKVPGYLVETLQPISPSLPDLYYFKTAEGTGVVRTSDYGGNVIVPPLDMVRYSDGLGSFVYQEGKLQLIIDHTYNYQGKPIVVDVPLDSGSVIQLSGEFPTQFLSAEEVKVRNTERPESVRSERTGTLFYSRIIPDSLDGGLTSNGVAYLSAEKQYDRELDTLIFFPNDPVLKFDHKGFMDFELETNDIGQEFELKVLTASMIYIRDNKRDVPGFFKEDQLFYSEEMLDINDPAIFEPAVGGYAGSGVYDLEQKKWIVSPTNIAVEWMSGNVFLLHQPIRNNAGLLVGSRFVLKQEDKEKELYQMDHEVALSQWRRPDYWSSRKYSEGDAPFYGIYRLTDSLVVINQLELERRALPIMDEYGLDSLDADGNVVYHRPEVGSFKSGILNVFTNEWHVPDQYISIEHFTKELVAAVPKLNQEGFIENVTYEVYDLKGNLLKKSVKYTDLDEKQQEFFSWLKDYQ